MLLEEKIKRRLMCNSKIIFWVSPLQKVKLTERNDTKDMKRLSDIIESGEVDRKYSHCLDSNYYKGTNLKTYKTKHKRQIVMEKLVNKVKVRKHYVDITKLKELLRSARITSGLTIHHISVALELPKTKVEHWFRIDNSFAIPDEFVWFELKKLLKIKTEEFDKPITEFEIRDNKYDMGNRIYHIEGISPTLTVHSGGQHGKIIYDGRELRLLTPIECLRLQGFPDDWFPEDISNTQRYKQLGNAVTTNVIKSIVKSWLENEN